MTAMLYFTKLVFSYGNGEQPVSAFQDETQKIVKVQNEDIMRANIEMFKRDLIKHKFDHDFDEYAVGFNLDVKLSLYRFPSILRQLFQMHLDRLIGHKSLVRLLCYLRIDSSSRNISLSGADRVPNTVSGIETLLFEQIKQWEMPKVEFLIMCQGLLVTQSHFSDVSIPDGEAASIHAEQKKTAVLVNQAVGEPDRRCACIASFYTCDWQSVINSVFINGFVMNDEDLTYAKAMSMLQLREYQEASTLYQHLLEREKQGELTYHRVLPVYRGLARCYDGQGKLEKALLTHQAAPIESTMNSHNKSSKPFSKHNIEIQKSAVMAEFEIARLSDRTLSSQTPTLMRLFAVLKKLATLAATSGKRVDKDFLKGFKKCPYSQNLDYISNPTREIAHCMYAIGEVFDQAREFELAEKYYQKSKDLGLCVVADKVSDAKTTLSMIVNLGGALNDPQLLSIAPKLLKETGV